MNKIINSVWTRQLENGQKPSSSDLLEHINAVHKSNAGFTETVAWNCRDVNGKNSYELLADIINEKNHHNVLDLACGSGVLLDLCNKRFGNKVELSGIDISEAELKLARKRLINTDIKLHQSMAQDLNFIADKSLDVILCHWALTLMDPVAPVFNTVNRVLKKNGFFAAIVDGDSNIAPGYLNVHNIIYQFVQHEYPNYGFIELGDPRVRTIAGLHELSKSTSKEFDINISSQLLSFSSAPDTLAREVAGFFYASFVLSSAGHIRMLTELESYFSSQLKNGVSCFVMPVNLLVIKKK